MPRYIQVSINLQQIDGAFDYVIPSEMEAVLKPGCLVIVPFNKRLVQGVTLGFVSEPAVPQPLEIHALLSPETVFTPQQLELASWLAAASFAPLGACIRLMIPAGLSQHADIQVERVEGTAAQAELPTLQRRLLNLLDSRGSLRGAQIDRAIPKLDWHGSLEKLRRAGLVRISNVLLPPRVSAKTVRSVQASLSTEEMAGLDDRLLGVKPEVRARRRAILQQLAGEPFPTNISSIYAHSGASYADLTYLAEKGLLHLDETEVWRDPIEQIQPATNLSPALTEDQQIVWQSLAPTLGQPGQPPALLHGVTGSGKTEIYLRAVAEALSHGKQSLLLVPEIAMTPQTVRRLMARFPNQVGLYHSKLSEGENYDTWRRARKGELKVIIGSRSALFLPLPNLGLIVLDECDHESYDETERVPFYHAVETAEAYARIASAHLILGSATPRITQYFKAKTGVWRLYELPRRVLTFSETIKQAENASFPEALQPPKISLSSALPPVEVVDMRQELKAGNTSALSKALKTGLSQALSAGQQAILFLNRKGSATYVFCRTCGEALRCPHDNQPLVYYDSREQLICNLDGYARKMPEKCPHCGSKKIAQFGLGTERLEKIVQDSFPRARILRWDAETTTTKGAHDLILSHFSAHQADILLGTQMLAKGLDLPLVTLVGIVLAETGLNLPDYRAAERTFQVLTQVSGRAGRSLLGGKVVLQTYQPDNYVIQAVAHHDFEGFYQQELTHRRELAYPPYTRLLRLEFRHLSNEKCQAAANELAGIIREEIQQQKRTQTSLIGPVPCYYPKMYGLYRWQILLRSPEPLSLLPHLPLRNWFVEVDPPNLL